MSDPSDDEIRAKVDTALEGLSAAVARAIDRGDRAACLQVARDWRVFALAAAGGRTTHTHSLLSTQADRIYKAMEEAREHAVRMLGTAAWDEPDDTTRAPAAPSIGFASDPGQLLSDTELEAAEAVVRAAIRWTD